MTTIIPEVATGKTYSPFMGHPECSVIESAVQTLRFGND